MSDEINQAMIPKPCPLCGHSSIYDGIFHEVRCENISCGCRLETPHLSHRDTIASWNSRRMIVKGIVRKRLGRMGQCHDRRGRRV